MVKTPGPPFYFLYSAKQATIYKIDAACQMPVRFRNLSPNYHARCAGNAEHALFATCLNRHDAVIDVIRPANPSIYAVAQG
jgi:hypothetical protein